VEEVELDINALVSIEIIAWDRLSTRVCHPGFLPSPWTTSIPIVQEMDASVHWLPGGFAASV
jgi:hypothetical protein